MFHVARYLRLALPVKLIDSEKSALAALPDLLAANEIGIDAEGCNLSRWGKLSLLQLRTAEAVYVCDALVPGVVHALKPALGAPHILKIAHDCREDSSALYHQFGVSLAPIFDTQVAYLSKLCQEKNELFSVSLRALQANLLDKKDQISMTKEMTEDSQLWLYRPIASNLVKYAMADVLDLLELRSFLSPYRTFPFYLKTIQAYSDYRFLNQHVRKPLDLEKRGLRLKAMLAAQSPNGSLVFKLNCGKCGIVSGASETADFQGVVIGDIVDCYVTRAENSNIFISRF